jgi:hypothetical protein
MDYLFGWSGIRSLKQNYGVCFRPNVSAPLGFKSTSNPDNWVEGVQIQSGRRRLPKEARIKPVPSQNDRYTPESGHWARIGEKVR